MKNWNFGFKKKKNHLWTSTRSKASKNNINSFLANVPILQPWNQRFSGVFSGDKTGVLATNALTYKNIKTTTLPMLTF